MAVAVLVLVMMVEVVMMTMMIVALTRSWTPTIIVPPTCVVEDVPTRQGLF